MEVMVAGASVLYDYIFPVRTLPSQEEAAEVLLSPQQLERYYRGGTAFNIAVTMAKLGVRVGVAHVVGRDFPGSEYESELQDLGVSLEALLVSDSQDSGRAYNFFASDGASVIFSAFGAAHGPLDVQSALEHFGENRLLILAPVIGAWMKELAEEAYQDGFSLAAVGIGGSELVPLLPKTRYVIGNEREVQGLCYFMDVDHPAQLVDLGPELIVETRGRTGSRIMTASEALEVPAVRPSERNDPTGAGDAYAGALLASLDIGLDPLVAGMVASTAASFVVERTGCQTNVPEWPSILSRMEEQIPEFVERIHGPVSALLDG